MGVQWSRHYQTILLHMWRQAVTHENTMDQTWPFRVWNFIPEKTRKNGYFQEWEFIHFSSVFSVFSWMNLHTRKCHVWSIVWKYIRLSLNQSIHFVSLGVTNFGLQKAVFVPLLWLRKHGAKASVRAVRLCGPACGSRRWLWMSVNQIAILSPTRTARSAPPASTSSTGPP